MNIISDIAGQYKTLMALLKKMPDDYVLGVGDLVDRGPDSSKVIEWFMEKEKMGEGNSLLGNHEHLMVDYYKQYNLYEKGTWFYNGGGDTFDSFNGYIAPEIIRWLEHRPLYKIINEQFLVSHAFVHSNFNLKEVCDMVWKYDTNNIDFDYSIIWNRSRPIRRELYQIAGHNSQFGLKRFSDDEGEFAIGIDTSREKVLTGIHIPSMKIYQQEYIK